MSLDAFPNEIWNYIFSLITVEETVPFIYNRYTHALAKDRIYGSMKVSNANHWKPEEKTLCLREMVFMRFLMTSRIAVPRRLVIQSNTEYLSELVDIFLPRLSEPQTSIEFYLSNESKLDYQRLGYCLAKLSNIVVFNTDDYKSILSAGFNQTVRLSLPNVISFQSKRQDGMFLPMIDFGENLKEVRFSLTSNMIDSVETWSSLSKIESLDLSESTISISHVDFFTRLTNLVSLDISSTSFGWDSNVIDLTTLVSLTKLSLRRTEIKSKALIFPKNLQVLDLSSNSLVESDFTSFRFPTSLEYLDLSENILNSSEYVRMPPNLKMLKLAYTKLRRINLEQLPTSLVTLNLSHNNQLVLIESDFSRFSQLKYLNISYTNSLLDYFIFPDTLISLIGSGCYIKDQGKMKLPETLRTLNLARCWLVDVSKILRTPFLNLEYLDLSLNKGLNYGLGGIEEQTNLKTLKLNSMDLRLIEVIQFPESLESLEMSGNQIYDIHNVEFPKSLVKLDLSLNYIKNIEDVVWPERLRYLDLRRNSLQSIPMAKLPVELRELCVNSNLITTISGVVSSKKLRRFEASRNHIYKFEPVLPPTIAHVCLSTNFLIEVPKFPDSLEFLELGENRITMLSEVVLPSNLIELHCERNLIHDDTLQVELPMGLRILNLSNNWIKGVGTSFKHLPGSLTKLYLSGNRINNIADIEYPAGIDESCIVSNRMSQAGSDMIWSEFAMGG